MHGVGKCGEVNIAFADLRTFVNYLERRGELLRMEEELDPKFEVPAVIRYGAGKTGKAILVDSMSGSPIDPTAEGNENIVSKLGIDANKPLNQKEKFRRVIHRLK